jgi:hypothetical protein
VRDYLIGKGVNPGRAHAAAESTEVPLSVTKRGRARVRTKAPSAAGYVAWPDSYKLDGRFAVTTVSVRPAWEGAVTRRNSEKFKDL